MPYKLGKQPATEDPRDLMFAKYANPSVLPTPPATFGHEDVFDAKSWGMLGNDQWGDCAWAGPAHETELWTSLGGKMAMFTTDSVLGDYSAGTGFDLSAGPPGSNPTDQGSNVRDVAKYRAKTGIADGEGKRHKIGAYVKVKTYSEALIAAYVFEVVGLGIEFPGSAMDQFNNGQPWDVVKGAQIEGGHYIPLVAKRHNLVIITWGAAQEMTEAFYEKYVDEAWVYLTQENLKGGKTPEGFDLEQLQADLKAL